MIRRLAADDFTALEAELTALLVDATVSLTEEVLQALARPVA